jgi:D-glycerate 3-kinase
MHPLDWRWPRRWRFQAEARQRRQGGNTLSATALDQLVRASLCSLPPELYQQPLLVSFETPDLDRSSTSRTEGSVIPIGTAALLDQRRRLQTLLQPAPG